MVPYHWSHSNHSDTMSTRPSFTEISETATAPSRSWASKHKLQFHYFNPAGLVARKDRNDAAISALVESGKVAGGAILAYGGFAHFHRDGVTNGASGKTRVSAIRCTVLIEGLREHCEQQEKFIASHSEPTTPPTTQPTTNPTPVSTPTISPVNAAHRAAILELTLANAAHKALPVPTPKLHGEHAFAAVVAAEAHVRVHEALAAWETAKQAVFDAATARNAATAAGVRKEWETNGPG